MLNLSKLLGRVNSLKRSSDAKVVASNFGYLLLLQVASYLFPLITIPYLSITIGTEGFGRIAFAAAIITWANTINGWGFNYTSTRDIAQCKEDNNSVSAIFTNVFWAKTFLALIVFLLLSILILIIPSFRSNWLVILLSFLIIPGHILFPEFFFQALERMKYITIFNFIIKAIFTIAIFIVIKEPQDYLYQPLLISIGYILCGLVSMYIIIHRWGYHLFSPDFKKILSTIKGSTDVFINNLMPNLYNSFSIILLGGIGGGSATGIFDGGNKFVSLIEQLFSSLSRAFYPFLSRKIDKHSYYSYITLFLSFSVSLLLFIFAPTIVRLLLAPEFFLSYKVLRILSISLFFMTLSVAYGTNYLIIVHKEKTLRNITFICSVFGMAIAYPLISSFSYLGVAYTILICRLVLGVSVFICAKKHQMCNSNGYFN